MKPDSPPAPPQRRHQPCVPPFCPVRLRARSDGWIVKRQTDLLSDALGAPVRKVTVDDDAFLASAGLIRLRFFRGRYRGSRHS